MTYGTIFDGLPIWDSQLFTVKAVDRKSRFQPQTWFLANNNGMQFVIKFSSGSEQANDAVKREIDFYTRLEPYRNNVSILAVLPKCISTGKYFAGHFLILEYCKLKYHGAWISSMMEWRSSIVIRWQTVILAWLLEFQRNSMVNRALSIPPGQVICHGDFSHFNILGSQNRFKVFDWEDWTTTVHPFLDAFHMVFQPTRRIISGDAKTTFQKFWMLDNPYRRHAIRNLTPFLSGMDWREAMG
ncbi:MAG: hypothetical protein WCQ90_15310, partial [Deltaproteobacteria bacterium]